MATTYKAAIIGCGNIACLMDEDPLRKEIWTHAKAYANSDRFELVAAADPVAGKRERITELYGVRTYATAEELLGTESPDVVSVCTPITAHAAGVESAVRHGVKAVFCEKPITAAVADAKKVIRLCREASAILQVNHPRRWDDNYRVPARLIKAGEIGEVKFASATYSNKLVDTGTHLFDTLRMLLGEIEQVAGELFDDDPEPYAVGRLRFASQMPCAVWAVGKKEDLIFEFDLVGTEGRLRLLDNGTRLELYRWQASGNYTGYRELQAVPVQSRYEHQRMVEAVGNLAVALDGTAGPACTGEDGLAALKVIEAFKRSHRDGGAVIRVKDI